MEGKGSGKDIFCISQNAALFVDLLYNVFYTNTQLALKINSSVNTEHWTHDDENVAFHWNI